MTSVINILMESPIDHQAIICLNMYLLTPRLAIICLNLHLLAPLRTLLVMNGQGKH